MGWTLATARAQPYEDLVLLAADFLLEAEAAPQPPPDGAAPGPSANGPANKRVRRTTTYQAE